jgi:hypothetical protein
MKPIKTFAPCLALAAAFGIHGIAQSPTATIDNGRIKATLYLPDAKAGYYRGTRFDWSGIVNSLQYAGHNYYGTWYTKIRPDVSDYVYEGSDILTGPCTNMMGVPEEFTNANHTALGWEDAKVGGTFVKIGIGALRKPDDQPYSNYRLYDIVNGGNWTIQRSAASIEFTQDLSDPASGYGYVYRKRVSLTPGQPQMVLEHSLRNTGTRPVVTSVYDHNFTSIDRQPIGPGLLIKFGFAAIPVATPEPKLLDLLQFKGSQVSFARTLTGQDKVAAMFTGFNSDPRDYNVRIEDHRVGAGVHITADRPLSKVALWGIRTVISPEPFIDMTIAPGAEFTWTITYDYYTVPRDAN